MQQNELGELSWEKNVYISNMYLKFTKGPSTYRSVFKLFFSIAISKFGTKPQRECRSKNILKKGDFCVIQGS